MNANTRHSNSLSPPVRLLVCSSLAGTVRVKAAITVLLSDGERRSLL